MASLEIVNAIRQGAEFDMDKGITPQGWRASGGKETDFDAFFSRDQAICAKFRFYIYSRNPGRFELLAPVKSSLITMALHQGQNDDPRKDEEYGKIHHELRYSDSPRNEERLAQLAARGWYVEDYLHYFGAVDPSPLFVDVGCEYFLLTGDLDFFKQLNPHIRAAVSWIIKNTEKRDHYGYVRFAAQNRNALINQGWKDSFDSIEIAPGIRPKEPIALVEVQGYTYSALLNAAEVFRRIGDVKLAKELYHRAEILKQRFNEEFWMEDEGSFAYALGGDNNQVKDITSNTGHLLFSDIIDRVKIGSVVNRLIQPDIFTQYGIRTLSVNSHYFSDKEPSAYHNGGSIWPHDNVIIYVGLKKHGFLKEAGMVRDAILDAQYQLLTKYGIRNCELFMVDRNGSLRPYDTAQHPQSWADEANYLLTEPLEVSDLLAA